MHYKMNADKSGHFFNIERIVTIHSTINSSSLQSSHFKVKSFMSLKTDFTPNKPNLSNGPWFKPHALV